MGHYSYIVVAEHRFLACRDGYLSELAALFTEADRRLLDRLAEPRGQTSTRFAYVSTVTSLRERLQVQGVTASYARERLAGALAEWRKERPVPVVPEPAALEDSVRQTLASSPDDLPIEMVEDYARLMSLLDEVGSRMGFRSFVRLLLELAPDDAAEVSLDLTDLTGCCVELDPEQPIAVPARDAQLAELAQNAPLLVLTEGTTDARLLRAGMEVTHPHLTGFVAFFDYDSSGAEGGVAQLVRTVAAFLGAGVANRFVALADNDTEAHAALEKLKKTALPDRCRVLHYPPLPLLQAYPTLGPYSDEPVVADINGRAGALEMYLGCDVLRDEGGLMPVQWRSWNSKLGQYQGSLSDVDKKGAQKRYEEKVRAYRAGNADEHVDWSGVQAIIDSIVTAFD